MAEQELLDYIAERIKEARKRLMDAKELMSLMQEAGEDVSKMREEIAQLERRISRWESVLIRRGMKV